MQDLSLAQFIALKAARKLLEMSDPQRYAADLDAMLLGLTALIPPATAGSVRTSLSRRAGLV